MALCFPFIGLNIPSQMIIGIIMLLFQAKNIFLAQVLAQMVKHLPFESHLMFLFSCIESRAEISPSEISRENSGGLQFCKDLQFNLKWALHSWNVIDSTRSFLAAWKFGSCCAFLGCCYKRTVKWHQSSISQSPYLCCWWQKHVMGWEARRWGGGNRRWIPAVTEIQNPISLF